MAQKQSTPTPAPTVKVPRKTLSAEDVAKKGAALKPVKTFQA